MACKSCCNLSLLTRIRIFGGLTIVLSVVNVILLLLTFGETLQQQRTDFKEFYDPYGNSAQNTNRLVGTRAKLRVSTVHAIRACELLLNLFTIVVCVLQLVHNVKKDCLWITNTFLVIASVLLAFSFTTSNVIYIVGIISGPLYAYHLVLYGVYFCFIFLVFWSFRKVSEGEECGEEGEPIDGYNVGMEGSQISNIDEVTMETRFT
ncbi:unnamed protein product [Orchesella dallaii]|uniref:Uncharacterized protein n=1 Tax=Orchesella dallaii TaxID=48710 RepID=A0ABP1RGG5_9HEXA